jgi:hypothetical protein
MIAESQGGEMNYSLRLSALSFVLAATFVSGDALAQKAKYNPFTLVKSLKKEKKKSGARGAGGPKRIREGGFKVIKAQTVKVSGGATLKLSEIIKANFGDAQKKEGSRGARSAKSRGLYIKPAVEEHAIETKDTFVVSRRTTYVVSNPKKHGFKGHRAKKGSRGGRDKKRVKKGQYKLSKIPAKQQKFYRDVIIPSLPKLPKDHPLRAAYDKKGMAGFLNAFADGKGDYSVNDEVIVPKDKPTLIGGRVRFPGAFMVSPDKKKSARGKKARFETTKKINWLTNVSKKKSKDVVAKPNKKYSYQESGGSLSYDHKFLTGWTWSKHWGKTHHKDYWLLEYKFWANVGFTIGFRVPVKFKGKMSPAYIKTFSNKKSGDKKGSFSVTLSADAFDGDTSYYKSVGWTDKDVKARGKEFPFHLYLNAGAFVEIMGKDILKKEIGEDIDYSQDLKPVYGKNQVLKMKGPGEKKFKNAAFYIPAEITQTVWRVGNSDLWAKAEGLIGAELGGDGSVSAKIRPVINGKAGKAKTISLTRGETKTAGPFTIPKKSNFGTTKYGYKISDPKYKWVVKIRPAIKGVISGECDHWWCGYAGPSSYTLGPWYPMGWIKLGTIKLNRHKGTTPSYTVQDGKKEFIKEDIKGTSSMHVCLKTLKGRYLYSNSNRFERVSAQYANCDLNTTFKMQSSSPGGGKNAPMMHGRTVSLKSAFGRYLSVDKKHTLSGSKGSVGKNERFLLTIVGGKNKQVLKPGDKVYLKTAHGRFLTAINGGGGAAAADRKKAKTWEKFTVVETKKKTVKWTCKDGKRDGHSNCSVKKVSALSKLKKLCNRDGTKCPCYIKKAKKSKTAEVWCLEKIKTTVKMPKYKPMTKTNFTKAKSVCSKKSKRRPGLVKGNSNTAVMAVTYTSTECKVASFSATTPNTMCKAVSGPKVTTAPLPQKIGFTAYLQNQFDQKSKTWCPYWISSHYKQIAARAVPKE